MLRRSAECRVISDQWKSLLRDVFLIAERDKSPVFKVGDPAFG